MLLEIGQIIHERYRIAKLLDEDNHRNTYRAWDLQVDKAVFLEQILPATLQSAPGTAETKIAQIQALDHTNLPQITDTFTSEQGLMVVSAQVDGNRLAGLLDREGPVPISQALGWINQIIDGLSALHNQHPPFAHGDLNPQNVLITPEGKAVLIGICIPSSQLCAPATGYAAVELYRGEEATPASDIYALGATLYTMLTGRIPPDSPQRTAGRPFTPAHQVNPQVPTSIHAVIEHAMALNPQDRFSSAADLRTALMQALIAQPQPAPKPPARGTKPLPEELTSQPAPAHKPPAAVPPTPPPYTPTMKAPEPVQPPAGMPPIAAMPETKKAFPMRTALIIAFVVLCIVAIGLGFGVYTIVTNIQETHQTETAEAVQATEVAATTTQRFILTSTAAFIATRNANATATANQATAYVVATQQFIAGQTATAAAQITEQYLAAQSATAAAQETKNAQASATQNAWLGIVNPLGFPGERTQVFGPWAGNLNHDTDRSVESYFADVDLMNFVAQAVFTNPFSASNGKWSYGFMFRDTGANSEFRMIVRSNKNWALERWNNSLAGTKSGNIANLKTGSGESNMLMLICVDGKGYLIVNGVQAAELDISRKQEAGDIAVVTGFYEGDEKDGETTAYEDFIIWSIP